ncbi:substrate-binding domain-containing protein [Kineosporia mesophila]|uniref:Substrate-binding domain-containing protein n=1 Tax=Kineosporia mesophila TaxID=566012 RepID=A0ABP6ZMU5_9ACTN|nr:substrate-binding domain-containing protein [Kineosporia mesophila]MCD5354757.1 substrate-binding domain-containing protein [Kineosporia mesophila]
MAACGSDSESGAGGSGGDSVKLGVIYLDTQGFYGGVKKGIDDGAAEAGTNIKVVETNAQDDASKESTFMTNLVAQQVDAIMLSASSATASVPAIRAASQADIPVICYNTCITEPDLGKYVTAYTLGDPEEFGYQLGTAAAEYFQSAKIDAPRIGVVDCEFLEVCVQRRAGFDKAMKEKLPAYTIVANQKGGDASASLTAAQNILTAHPDLDGFMGEYGDATVGAIKAVQNADRVGKTVVFGGDMTTDIANALKDGSVLKAQVDIGGQTMGKAAVKAALDAVEGKKPAEVVVPVQVDLYSPRTAADWLTAHADGIP